MLTINAEVVYRVGDVHQWLYSCQNPEQALQTLSDRVLMESTANKPLDEVLSHDLAGEKYGVKIEEVGLERLSLPEGNTKFVFDQMRAERRQYAARYRAEGEREADLIRSKTTLEVAEIRATGEEEAARIRGQAEAEAARIYADAHSADPEFYRFTRSLEALNKMLSGKSSVVLRTDSPPFDLLEGSR